ncbi:type I-E CRISPR-associated protein Cas7/Cse4/CasC [Kitasatospora sp. NPDC101235]|uniref:type I-E CRISPR-associated protein Cas7/Cse4/CasC n=1 Tax=Kitasatospora sp. NPDC101235 TaxID=3364101 RepID=UPI00382DD68A
MTASPVHVDVHILQNYPYSNLNRDRWGRPKQAQYGGSTRSRTSSQHESRTRRGAVETATGIVALRTRHVPELVADTLTRRGWNEEIALAAGRMMIPAAQITGLGLNDAGTTNALLFLPDTAIDALADVADAHKAAITKAKAAADKDEKAAKTSRGRGKKPAAGEASDTADTDADTEDEQAASAVFATLAEHAKDAIPPADVRTILATRNASIAAFGRMLANEPGSEVRGASHTAHALTTHQVEPELDFYDAIDDVQHTHGAAHLGEQHYSSGVYYAYNSLNIPLLLTNLDQDWDDVVQEIVRAYLRAAALEPQPAKATSTAPFTLPHLLYIAVRTDRPVSLVGAFETPVPATEDGYLPESIHRLDAHAAAVHEFLGTSGLAAHAHAGLTDAKLPALGERIHPVDDLVDWTLTQIGKALA